MALFNNVTGWRDWEGGGGTVRCYLVITGKFNAIRGDAFESVGGFNVLIMGISADCMEQERWGGG